MKKFYELSPELHRKMMACFPWSAGKSSDHKMRCGFRAEIHAQQIAWPADCPLTEAELRSEIRSLCDSARAVHERAEELFGRLPESRDDEFESEVPPSIYFALYDAVSILMDVPEILKSAERELAATPESLRDTWLESQLRRIPDRIGGREADKARDRVVAAVGRLDLDRPAESE